MHPTDARAAWLRTDDPTYPARIMAECGCGLQDIAITFGLTLPQALRLVGPIVHTLQAWRQPVQIFLEHRALPAR